MWSFPRHPVITYKKVGSQIGIFEVVLGEGCAELEWLGWL